ncbi:hypothetical protein MHAEM_21771 [Mycolicibacterium phlei]|nr:hypothetical protein [Mycolicibacterium phlei]
MLNLELLQKVRDKVLLEPDKHKQEVWMVVGDGLQEGDTISCPTAACVAGWACALTGDVGVVGRLLRNPNNELWVDYVITPEGETVTVFARGRQLLGLTEREAEDLFDEHNTRQEVLDKLDDLIRRAKGERN